MKKITLLLIVCLALAWQGFSQTTVTCGSPTNQSGDCYVSGANLDYQFVASDATQYLTITVNAGQVENNWDEFIVYDGADATAPELYNGYGTAGDLAGLTFTTTGANLFVRIQADGSVDCVGSSYTPLDFDVVCTTPPSCIDPSMLTANTITTTSAVLGWTENGTATAWNIEIVASGSSPTGTPTASGVANPYSVTGLTAATGYEFYVQADCAADGTSNWVGPFAFTTPCNATAAPYTEDFETFTTADAAFTIENCWTGSGGAYFWESAPGTDAGSGGTGPDASITTGNYFYTEASNGTTGDTTDLLSPLVDLTALTDPALTFNYHMFGGDIGTLDILVNGTDNVWSLSGQQQTSETSPWELAVVDLAAYAGQTISVTFRATSAGTFEGDMAIDNVSFTELPACPAPNALTVTNIEDDSADLGWTENGSATAWDIEIVDVTAGGTATGTPTSTGVTNPYTAMGLVENNDYQFYVRSDCGSTWAGPFSFTTLETCPRPSALTATNIMETSAVLGWTENGSATSWNIEIVDITAGGTVTGTATTTGVTNPYTIMNLVGDNAYEFYVQADCGADGTSAWVGPFAFNTPYVAVAPDCTNGIFLDTGGQSGDYSSSETITWTICPDNSGDAVSVNFSSFSTENNGDSACYDGLTIYNGADATAATIDPPAGGSIWCWDRNDATPSGTGDLQGMTITSSDASGCLTFVFTSDGSVTRPGWIANVTCNTLSLDNLEQDAVFTYHPNPVENTLTLNAQNNIQNVSVYNMLGQEVVRIAPNTIDTEVDMSDLQIGTYFVKVTINNATKTIKVLKK